MKIWLGIFMMALLVCLVVMGLRPAEPVASRFSDTSKVSGTFRGPSFEVEVIRPRSARPLFGILPSRLEAKLLGPDLRFDGDSPGAKTGIAKQDHLELRADSWELSIKADRDGRINVETYLVFPVVLADKERKLRCRPAGPGAGHLRTSKGMSLEETGLDRLDGHFLFELASCVNTATGKTIDWPSSPLIVRGSFWGLPQGHD
ncbi:MAG: hypothetical protein K0U98_00145 [Deltaproteobacteria bacterium]|nr:hypothetical protein [Deltaproteobacteria bacterium]